MLDYTLFPPEVNSLRMYTGPGVTSLVESATAWENVASELALAASGWSQTLISLTSMWLGPSATNMVGAASLYQSWLTLTATLCEQTVAQITAAISAYEIAYAATISPPLVTANRTQLASLVATNFLGINTPAILATEAEYMEFWVQDATAMLEYQVSSMQATQGLQTFSPMSTMTTMAPMAAPSGIGTGSAASAIDNLFNDPLISTLNGYGQNFVSGGSFNPTGIIGLLTGGHDFFPGQAPDTLAATPRNLFSEPEAVAAGVAPPQTSRASAGTAAQIGRLSVPQTWVEAAPASRTMAAALPQTTINGQGGVPGYPGVPLTGTGQSKSIGAQPRYGTRPIIMTRPPAGG